MSTNRLVKGNRHWVESLAITEDLWKQLMQVALNGIIRLLDASDKLLLNGGSEAICAGLYTYAVEEYGKILLLKQCVPANGKVIIEFKRIFRDHPSKFEVAFKHLPTECKVLEKGMFDPDLFDNLIFDVGLIADFEARMAVFYCDIANSGDSIKQVPSVDKNLLKNAVDKLKTIAHAAIMS
jgi:AbiV family abortive infection protein